MIKNIQIKIFCSGQLLNEGTYACTNCGQKIYLENGKPLPVCQKCGGRQFTIQLKKSRKDFFET